MYTAVVSTCDDVTAAGPSSLMAIFSDGRQPHYFLSCKFFFFLQRAMETEKFAHVLD